MNERRNVVSECHITRKSCNVIDNQLKSIEVKCKKKPPDIFNSLDGRVCLLMQVYNVNHLEIIIFCYKSCKVKCKLLTKHFIKNKTLLAWL